MVRTTIVLAALLFCQTAGAAEQTTKPNSNLDPAQMEVADTSEWETPPKLIKGKSPVFPISLLLSGKSGRVVIQYVIDTNGRTRDFVVVSAPDKKFADHAIIALKKWIYQPAMEAGLPIEATVRQTFTFSAR